MKKQETKARNVEDQIKLSAEMWNVIDDSMKTLDKFNTSTINSLVLILSLLHCKEAQLRDYLLEYTDNSMIYAVENAVEENIPVMQSSYKELQILPLSDGNFVQLTTEVMEIIEVAYEISTASSIEMVEPIQVVSALFLSDNMMLRSFFRSLAISYTEAKNYFTSDEIFEKKIVPLRLSKILKDLNREFSSEKKCDILCREKELSKIWNILLKEHNRNFIIAGEPGSGKKAIIKRMVYEILTKQCPKKFKDFHIFELNVSALLASTKMQEKIEHLISFFKQNTNSILFVDEIQTIIGRKAILENGISLYNLVFKHLTTANAYIIGTITFEEYNELIDADKSISQKFEKIILDGVSSKEVYPMIKEKIKGLSKYHGVKISRQVIDFAIMIGNCFESEIVNPGRTLDLLDRAMAATARIGESNVSKNTILDSYNVYFDILNEMTEDDKLMTAYHEAGHWIVGRSSERLSKSLEFLAVSIIPANDYAGVTVAEYAKNKIPYTNLEYYIDTIAYFLGGRVGESMYTNESSGGAASDLVEASKYAYAVISQCGLDTEINILGTLNIFSEKSLNQTNERAKALFEKGQKRAQEIIEKNIMLLKQTATLLVKKHIITRDELDMLWDKYHID